MPVQAGVKGRRKPGSSRRAAVSAPAVDDILRRLVSRIGAHKYDMWFGHTRLLVDGQRVEVAACNDFVANWIGAHFTEDLKGIVTDVLGGEPKIAVRVAPELFGRGDAGPGPASQAATPATQVPGAEAADVDGPGARRRSPASTPDRSPARPDGRTGRGPGPRRQRASLRRLDEFVVGSSNRLAFSTAHRLIEGNDADTVSPLFIHGDCGLGKTHLLQGICQQYEAETGRADSVRYVTGEQFTNEYIAAIRSNSIETFRSRVRKLDLLAIDDVHFLANKMRTQSEFLHTLNAIDLSGARVVIASDEHPRVIRKFSQALISRFLSGMVVRIERPDRETRVAIIRQLAAGRTLQVSDAAVEAVASRCVGSVRELEGAVVKLGALWSLRSEGGVPGGEADASRGGDEVGLVLVEQLFRDHGWHPPVPVRIDTVIDVVCERIGIGRADLMGVSRHRRVVLGRALVAYLGRTMTTLSYPELARAIGRPYHSTVHTAEQRLRRQLKDAETVVAGDAPQRPLPLSELVDQLRHEIARITAKA